MTTNLFYNIIEKKDNIQNKSVVYFNNETLHYKLYFLRSIVFNNYIFLKKNNVIIKNNGIIKNNDKYNSNYVQDENIYFICCKIIFLFIILILMVFIFKKIRE
jgi:hypothetical protein